MHKRLILPCIAVCEPALGRAITTVHVTLHSTCTTSLSPGARNWVGYLPGSGGASRAVYSAQSLMSDDL